ncbi:hypothetical protein F7Q99_04670 [Streptomyces kaniharaensis]|uniref:Uncharacterized protein n=1 Tax=Streptomyces kaniharaensis TaxID=212423 RepID=A0A6N7KMK6_9ACTN|nr:hypothetical protein [Streptomyces kaniharaensis]MQS11597.1 hypothetical protein [Streptomyces kaniharaensis]
MDAIVTSVIAVLGTLLGSTVTHVFQQRSARRMEHNARLERLRQERLEVYGAYAGLLVEFRQAMLHHWFCVHEGRDAEDEVALRGRSFETRSSAQHALFQLQLITDEPELVAVAVDAFVQVGKIDRAEDRADAVVRRGATRELIDTFVATARRHVGQA